MHATIRLDSLITSALTPSPARDASCAELRVGGPKVKANKRKSTKDGIRGRTDKTGTLIGFQDVFSPPSQ
eukprot:4493339-Prymnesium_polylepis.1